MYFAFWNQLSLLWSGIWVASSQLFQGERWNRCCAWALLGAVVQRSCGSEITVLSVTQCGWGN